MGLAHCPDGTESDTLNTNGTIYLICKATDGRTLTTSEQIGMGVGISIIVILMVAFLWTTFSVECRLKRKILKQVVDLPNVTPIPSDSNV